MCHGTQYQHKSIWRRKFCVCSLLYSISSTFFFLVFSCENNWTHRVECGASINIFNLKRKRIDDVRMWHEKPLKLSKFVLVSSIECQPFHCSICFILFLRSFISLYWQFLNYVFGFCFSLFPVCRWTVNRSNLHPFVVAFASCHMISIDIYWLLFGISINTCCFFVRFFAFSLSASISLCSYICFVLFSAFFICIFGHLSATANAVFFFPSVVVCSIASREWIKNKADLEVCVFFLVFVRLWLRVFVCKISSALFLSVASLKIWKYFLLFLLAVYVASCSSFVRFSSRRSARCFFFGFVRRHLDLESHRRLFVVPFPCISKCEQIESQCRILCRVIQPIYSAQQKKTEEKERTEVLNSVWLKWNDVKNLQNGNRSKWRQTNKKKKKKSTQKKAMTTRINNELDSANQISIENEGEIKFEKKKKINEQSERSWATATMCFVLSSSSALLPFVQCPSRLVLLIDVAQFTAPLSNSSF